MTEASDTVRSVLLTAASRPDLFGKVGKFGADVTVLDLEDATHPDDKASARASLPQYIAEFSAGWNSTFVRVNDLDSGLFESDVQTVVVPGLTGLVLPKMESPARLSDAIDLIASVEHTRDMSPIRLILGMESAAGVHHAFELAGGSDRISAVYFGAEDFIKDMGGVRTRGGNEVLYSRSRVVAAARLSGVWPVDQVVMDLKDDDFFLEDAFVGRSLGYRGKLCAHARQVALAHDVFPTAVSRPAPYYVESLPQR